jgi:CHASE2 domain-containing sensor protein/nitrogen-specific signal transduction histidine kinase/CheY-like chemotaxis protein
VNRKFWQWRGTLLIAPSVTALVLGCSALGIFRLLEWASHDLFFRLRPQEGAETEIVIVTIDEADLKAIGDWPIPDATLAKALTQLRALKPSVIGLDLYRDLPVEPGHQALQKVFQSTPNLIGVETILSPQRVASPSVLESAGQVGFADFLTDPDRKIRRGLLTVKDPAQGVDKHALSVQVAFRHLQAQGITAQESDGKEIRIGQAVFTPLDAAEAGYRSPEEGGYQLLMNWRGPITQFQTFSLTEVLAGQVRESAIRDRVVLIGSTAVSTNDFFSTPYGNRTWFTNSEPMAGVVVHANLTSQIIHAAQSGRLLLRGWSIPGQWLWVFVWASIGSTGGLLLDRANARQTAFYGLREVGGILSATSFLVGTTYWIFLNGWLIPVVPPLVALVFSGIAAISWHKQERLEVANTQLAKVNRQLRGYTKTLEVRVAERTQALAQAKEAADDANQAKSRFLANMSHELRTPLNAILGFTQLMIRDVNLEGIQRERTEIISHSGEHLLGLIDDVLVLSKIEAGQMTLSSDRMDLYRLLQTLKEMLQLEAETKGLKFVVAWEPDVPQHIATDQNRLRQILINLLSNAIKFTRSGGVTLHTRLADLDQITDDLKGASNRKMPVEGPHEKHDADLAVAPVCYLYFAVEDTGPGIEPEELQNIFEPFVQTRTGQQAQKGTGLGLAISQQFAQLMQGKIAVSSTPGKGTTVSLVLPVQPMAESRVPQRTPRVVGIAPGQPAYRILVAEGRWESRNLLGALLELVGFKVRAVEDGAGMIAACQSWHPDVVFLDLHLPFEGEAGVAQNLAAVEDDLRQCIVIALSTDAFELEQTRALTARYHDCIYKPFQEETIFASLGEHLGVRYLYEVDPLSPSTRSLGTRERAAEILTAEQLAQLSTDWLTQLDWAAQRLDASAVLALVEQLSEAQLPLANALKPMVKAFEFWQLMTLAQEAQQLKQTAPNAGETEEASL